MATTSLHNSSDHTRRTENRRRSTRRSSSNQSTRRSLLVDYNKLANNRVDASTVATKQRCPPARGDSQRSLTSWLERVSSATPIPTSTTATTTTTGSVQEITFCLKRSNRDDTSHNNDDASESTLHDSMGSSSLGNSWSMHGGSSNPRGFRRVPSGCRLLMDDSSHHRGSSLRRRLMMDESCHSAAPTSKREALRQTLAMRKCQSQRGFNNTMSGADDSLVRATMVKRRRETTATSSPKLGASPDLQAKFNEGFSDLSDLQQQQQQQQQHTPKTSEPHQSRRQVRRTSLVQTIGAQGLNRRTGSNRSLYGDTLQTTTSQHKPLSWKNLCKNALIDPLDTEKRKSKRTACIRPTLPSSVDAEIAKLRALLNGQQMGTLIATPVAKKVSATTTTTRRVPTSGTLGQRRMRMVVVQ